jgi:hypothetical protein
VTVLRGAQQHEEGYFPLGLQDGAMRKEVLAKIPSATTRRHRIINMSFMVNLLIKSDFFRTRVSGYYFPNLGEKIEGSASCQDARWSEFKMLD